MKAFDQAYLEVRSKICNAALVSFSILAIPLLAASLYRAVDFGWQSVMALHIVFAIALWSITLYRGKTPYIVRAGFIISLLLIIGFGGIWTFGLSAGAVSWLAIAPILSTIFFGTRLGLATLGAVLLISGAIGTVTVIEHRLPSFDLADYATSPVAWSVSVLTWIFSGGSVAVALGVLNKFFVEALKTAREKTEALRESEETARKAEALLMEAIESVSEGFAIFGNDDCLVACNEAYRQIYTTCRDIIVPGVSFEEIARKGAERGQFPAADGRLDTWIEERVEQHRNADGSVIEQGLNDGRRLRVIEHRTPSGYIVGNRIDITDLKRVEQAVRKINAELEQRVEDRTKELRETQAELVKKARLATLGQLAASVSHELRNPLGAISTSMAVVQHKVKVRELAVEQAMQRIRRSIDRCVRIIDEMLDYTRDSTPLLVPTDLDRWLEKFLDEQPLPDGIKLHRHLNAGNSPVSLDRDLFRRAVINLYNNACDAMLDQDRGDAPGHVHELVVETRCVGGNVEISIADNGAGMPSDILANSFEPLFSTKNFGTGLGLPIVKKIVEQHNGAIDIISDLGEGTRVVLTIPMN